MYHLCIIMNELTFNGQVFQVGTVSCEPGYPYMDWDEVRVIPGTKSEPNPKRAYFRRDLSQEWTGNLETCEGWAAAKVAAGWAELPDSEVLENLTALDELSRQATERGAQCAIDQHPGDRLTHLLPSYKRRQVKAARALARERGGIMVKPVAGPIFLTTARYITYNAHTRRVEARARQLRSPWVPVAEFYDAAIFAW